MGVRPVTARTLAAEGADGRSAVLVLARHVGQSVVLGEGVTVTVVEAHGGLVRLGIEAPVEVTVRRGELAPLERPGRPGGAPVTPGGPSGRRGSRDR